MNRTNLRNFLLVCACIGVMAAGQATAADIRYMNSGDYLDPNGWVGGVIPGINDTARFNWGNNTVTLSGEAPLLRRFQAGVDESGQLIVESGGKLTTTGGANSTVGNNGGLGVVGGLTVNTGGEVMVTNVLFVGASATGFLTVNGGTVSMTSHLWAGTTATGSGTIYVTNGGVLNVGGNIGLGTINASTASGGKALMYVQDNGTVNLTVINGAGNSIQPNSVLDITGTGKVTIPGDFLAVMSVYTNAGKITAYGGTGTVGIDVNTLNAGKTTLFAVVGEVPQTQAVWNPAANPTGSGKWNESANWTGGARPGAITKVVFNVPGAIPCTVSNTAVANHIVMGDNGPGGTLIVTNGGNLTSGTENASVIGYNSNGTMVVEAGALVTFGHQLWVGLNPESDGTFIMNGGTVSVANTLGLGWQGGKGTVLIKGGTLNLAQWDPSAIQGSSVLDISGTGKIIINGNQQSSIENYVLTGQITANGGTGTVVVDYNSINVGQTTVYPQGVYVPPAQVVWNPALNTGDTLGLWNVSANWSGGVGPSNVTKVIFNVADAIPCLVTNAAYAKFIAMGDNGPGGTLIITNGGSLTCSGENWSAVGYNNPATMIVENGASVTFGEHLWVGLNVGADGTFIMNGGTVSVNAMFGLGWSGGKGTAQINAGTLNLAQLHPTDSIKGESVLNITGSGKVVITGNHFTVVSNYISAGKITANAGPNVFYSFDATANKTTLSAVLLPAPRQPITAITASGGNLSITYQTTHQHTYYVESSPSLSPAVWTPVPGSTNAATGAPVTFTIPAEVGQKFYRTVSY